MQKQKYQAYAAATQTVARTKQIVMLYDGAIRFIKQARESIATKNIEERYNCLTKASKIITGLQYCLDFENGGDIARILYNFYSRMDAGIFAIHRSNSAQECDTIIEELRQMRELWHEIDLNESTKARPTTPLITASVVPLPAVEQPLIDMSEKNIILSA